MMIRRGYYAHFIFLLAYSFTGCTNHIESEPVDCEANRPGIIVESKNDPAGCNTNDGVITVSGSGGKLPYEYNINGGAYQPSGMFSQLNGGSFTIGIRDFNGCENEVSVLLSITSSDLAATVATEQDNECLSDNGSITITATGSAGPFEYKIGTGSFSADNVFSGLKYGLYDITVKDAQDCSISISATVARGETGVSWNSDIKSIIESNCAVSGCHVSGGQSPNFSVFANVQRNASNIKTRTANKSMPPDGRSISQEQINRITCWVDDGAKEN